MLVDRHARDIAQRPVQLGGQPRRHHVAGEHHLDDGERPGRRGTPPARVRNAQLAEVADEGPGIARQGAEPGVADRDLPARSPDRPAPAAVLRYDRRLGLADEGAETDADDLAPVDPRRLLGVGGGPDVESAAAGPAAASARLLLPEHPLPGADLRLRGGVSRGPVGEFPDGERARRARPARRDHLRDDDSRRHGRRQPSRRSQPPRAARGVPPGGSRAPGGALQARPCGGNDIRRGWRRLGQQLPDRGQLVHLRAPSGWVRLVHRVTPARRWPGWRCRPAAGRAGAAERLAQPPARTAEPRADRAVGNAERLRDLGVAEVGQGHQEQHVPVAAIQRGERTGQGRPGG